VTNNKWEEQKERKSR